MYYPYYYGFDWTYLYLVLPCVILSLWASYNVNSTFRKYSNQHSIRRLTGAEAAQRVLSANGVSGVRIERVSGNLTDHYDPKANVIRLSDSVYSSTSTAAIGVACHEAGHAVQYAVGYGPIRLRSAIIPATQLGSKCSFLLLVIGLALYSQTLFLVGIVLFSLTTVFQLVTLPVVFNASQRAIETIEGLYLLDDDEIRGAKRVLRAAALTYVAALLMSLLQLLRYVLIFLGRNGGRRGGRRE